MSIFKSIKFELLILVLITLSIFASFNLDLFFYSYFTNLSDWANGVFLKEFFSEITKLGSSSWYFSITIIGFVIFYINNKLQIIKTKSAKNLSDFFIFGVRVKKISHHRTFFVLDLSLNIFNSVTWFYFKGNGLSS